MRDSNKEEVRFWTQQEAARILKVSVRTLQRAAHRIGRKKGALGVRRYTDEDLKKLAGATR